MNARIGSAPAAACPGRACRACPSLGARPSTGARRLLRSALVLLGVLLLAPTGAAWNQSGHMQVASLVYDALSERARSYWVGLLRKHPRFAEDFAARLPPEVTTEAERARWIFLWASVWPDLLREQPAYEHRSWHYINLPLSVEDGALISCQTARARLPESQRHVAELRMQRGEPGEALRSAAAGGNPALEAVRDVRQAVHWARQSLADTSLPAPRRALALSWLLHLVADAHQPLHTVALFTARRFEMGDRGGNDILVCGRGSLHQVWDDLLGEDVSLSGVQQAARRLGEAGGRRRPAGSRGPGLEVDTWLQEGCELARRAVYVPAVVAVARQAEAEPLERTPEVRLPADYFRTAASAARARAALAAARLTALLRSVPSQSESPFPPSPPGH